MSSSEPVILVTGGSRGIGRATSLIAGNMGATVVVNYVGNLGAAESVVAEIKAEGGKAVAVQADVAVEADVLRLFAEVDKIGTLVGVVNNAGVVDVTARVDEMSVERLTRMFTTNITSVFIVSREAIRRMSTKHGGLGGAIVNVSSAAARLGGPGQYVDYAASKGAIDTFTVGLAREVAEEGIRVNGVRPGIIETDIHASGGLPDRARTMAPLVPMKRAGTADEVASAIAWLLSDDASYCTGSLLDISGGR